MSTESSPLEGPNTLAILGGAVDTVRTTPVVLGVFLLAGVLWTYLPPIFANVARFVFLILGVVIVSQVLGGTIHTVWTFALRLFIALLTTLASYLLLMLGILALVLPKLYAWIGFFTFISLGMYIYIRLILSTPAVILDGYGPAEALTASWQLMRGSVLATVFALLLMFLGVIVTISPLLLFVQQDIISNTVGIILLDTLLVGMQVFLYTELAETTQPTIHDDTITEPQEANSQPS